jgi:prevent-host-death family protein
MSTQMSSTIGLTEARERLTEILERVLDGERVVVTRYGLPVAAIVPVPADLDDRPRPLGLGALAGAITSRPVLYETVADVVALRSLARERPAPEIA